MSESFGDGNAPIFHARRFAGLSIALLIAVILAVLYWSYDFNRSCLMVGLDGSSYITYLDDQAGNREPFTQTGVDASQANFDAYYPLFREYLLPSALTLLFSTEMPSKTTIYFVFGLLCLFAFYVSARVIEVEWRAALLAGFIADVVGMPGFVHQLSQTYIHFSLNPYWMQNVVLSMFVVASFWGLRAVRRWPTPLAFAIATAPTLCLLLSVISTGAQTFFMVPAIVLYGSASLLDARRCRENIMRLFAAALMIIVPAALGVFEYFYGLVGYTAYNYFSPELYRNQFDSTYVSALWYPGIGRWTIVLGVIGAAWTVRAGSSHTTRLFAIVHLAVTAAFLSIGYIIVHFATDYHGSMPVYFEKFMWPYAVLFSAIAILASANRLALLLGSVRHAELKLGRAPVPDRVNASSATLATTERVDVIVIVALLALVAISNAAQALRPDGRCPIELFWPIRATPVTDFLQQRIALAPGKLFNGVAATIDGVGAKPSVTWPDLTNFDYQLWRNTGNDYRSTGLWRYRIPTLFQYYTFITPPFYLLLTEFLARPADRQERSVVVLSRANETMMRLWGVRYVITDTDLGIGREVLRQPMDEYAPFKLDSVRLIELSDVNLGDFSPTDARRVEDFRSGLALMRDTTFDGRRTVITNDDLNGTYAPASNVRLAYTKEGFHLSAESPSRSLIVLPVQFSRCWSIEGTGSPTLFRADLMGLGVNFTGALDARLVFNYGPILRGRCRVDDMRDMTRLRIQDALSDRR
jgi:hypothetical protein